MASAWDNMNPDFEQKLRGLMAEAGGRVTMVSGYRSPDRQEELYAKALARYGSPEEARKWVAPPGKSNHNKGLAVDLGGDLQLAHMLAPKYGLTFPMAHEAWHIEPAGLQSHPDAYTTPPDVATQDQAAPVADHIDKLYNDFNAALSGVSAGATGEVDTSKMGEFNANVVDSGAADTGVTNTDSPLSGATVAGQMGGLNDIDKFMSALGGQESGGNYNAHNGDSGAAGKYQIMPTNWGPWAREAGLAPDAAMDSANQEKVARFKIAQYYKQFGDWGKVADAWYGGPGSVGKGETASQGKYPTKSQYAAQVLARMGSTD